MIDTLGSERRRRPHDGCAPIVTDDMGPFNRKRIKDGGHVDRQERDRVGIDLGGLVARAVAALIGHDDLKSCVDQRGDLPGPKSLRVRKAVQQHERACPCPQPARRVAHHWNRPSSNRPFHRAYEAARATSSSRLGPGELFVSPTAAELDGPFGTRRVGRRSLRARPTHQRGRGAHAAFRGPCPLRPPTPCRSRTRASVQAGGLRARRRFQPSGLHRTRACSDTTAPPSRSSHRATAAAARPDQPACRGTTSRRATACIVPIEIPRPTDGLVHAHESANATTPVANGVAVQHERTMPVFDLGHHRDLIVERLTIEPMRTQRHALDHIGPHVEVLERTASPCLWRSR